MKRVLGIGGVLFKARDPEGLAAWYARHLGIAPDPQEGAFFPWRHDEDPERRGRTVWAPFPADTAYFAPSAAPFMLNYVVEDLDAVLEALRAEGVTVDERREAHPYGRFGWAMDPEGNRIELWEPAKKPKAASTRSVVEAYFTAWTTNDVDAAYACLAPDLEFVGPSASYRRAEEFRPALIGFAAMTKSARIAELVVDGDAAALLYDCELPAPAGMTRIASFFRVAGGKIRRYETLFDPAGLKLLVAARQRG